MIRSLLFLFVTICSLASGSPKEDVWKAREMLSPETWSGVVEITNEQNHPVYPKTTHALVFEFNDALWLYTPYDGTQSLSLTYGTTKQDRENLLPLLKGICNSFAKFQEVIAPPAEYAKKGEPAANACFIEAIAALGDKAVPRSRIRHASLLSMYPKGRLAGHTVLSYETDEGHFVFDAANMKMPIRVEHFQADDPLQMAKAAFPHLALAKARFLEIRRVSILAGWLAQSRRGKNHDAMSG